MQGEPLGRVNMSKIKPYHKPLEANTYVLEVANSTKLSLEENGIGTNKHSSKSNKRHLEESSYSYKGELHKFYKGQRVIRRYLFYQQGVTPFEQQKWVGSYTITRVHDDNTIQIDDIHQKDLGRWESSQFVLYDGMNPDQVINFDQASIESSTPSDYDEIHHKMLECYAIQPYCFYAQPVKDKTTNEVKIINFTPTKGTDYGKKTLHLSRHSHVTTWSNHGTDKTINHNTYDKQKIPFVWKVANMLTTKWLPHICKIWSVILIKLILQNWYLYPGVSSIHSSMTNYTKEGPTLTSAVLKRNYYTFHTSKEGIQLQHGRMKSIIHKTIPAIQEKCYYNSFFIAKQKLYPIWNSIGGVRTRPQENRGDRYTR